jgi:hypothetical protein
VPPGRPVPPGYPNRPGDVTPAPVRPYPYQQPYGQPYAGNPYPTPYRHRDDLATAGFVISLCGFLGVTLVLGPILCLVALGRIGVSGARGRNLAIAGLVIPVVWVPVLVVLAVAFADPNGTGQAGRCCTSRSADDLQVGDCLTGTPTAADPVYVVSCSAPHDVEVFYSFPYPAGSYPGEGAVTSTARSTCHDRLPERLGGYDVSFLYPPQGAWDQGIRDVTCLAWTPGSDSPQSRSPQVVV